MARWSPACKNLVEKLLHATHGIDAPTDSAGHEERKMTLIRATCPTCADVELTTDDVRLRVCTDTSDRRYVFECPRCLTPRSAGIDEAGAELLVQAGVELIWWNLPEELTDDKDGPKLTHDDLLAFHQFLADDDSISAALDTIT